VTYVRPPHLGSRVWAFPRAVHVRPGARKLLSWLENFPLGPANGEGVHPLALGALGPRAWLDAPWLQPGLVVVLAPPNRRATRVEPIDRATALSHLGSESISAAPGVCDEDGARDFVTLGRLVCSAPACRLSVGPDPADAAERLTTFWDALGVDDRTDVRRGRRAA
ncbi:MAG TPA: hypothetical protein PKC18_20450, partial [Lacipirellulaceae bacterium]|nr:hypothetical protein [Lacipirellulaceae bacterium]